MCGSLHHWARECPDREATALEVSKEDEQEKVQCFSFALTIGEKLLNQCLNSAIIDTGCTNSVCGNAWPEIFMESFSEEDRNKVICEQSDTLIVFGNMGKQKSKISVTLPVSIGKQRGTINCDVIEGYLLLLLSKPAMKRGGFKLFMDTDELVVKDKKLKLKVTPSGHYILHLFAAEKHAFLTNHFSK